MLWDPVVDGKAYLRELATLHRTYMKLEKGADDWRDRLVVDADGVPAEALGTPIRAAFAAELGAIDLGAEELPTDHVTLVRTSTNDAADRLRRPSVHEIALPASERWNIDGEQATAHPERLALLWDAPAGTMTYGELDRRSDVLAVRLIERGVAADVPVALALERSAEAIVAALAVLKAGGAYLPLDPEYPRERLRSSSTTPRRRC